MTSTAPVVDFAAALESVGTWLTEYISANHPDIGRTGPICPFVAPSRKNRTLETRLRLVGHTPTLELIEEIARSSLREYERTTWQGRNPMLQAMVVVLPDLRSEDTGLLDLAQERVKDDFVARGLMIGQFHENCEVTAARNPRFAVSRAPVPLLAIRSIALHDIFFLADHPHWFRAYREKFGKFFGPDSTVMDPLLVERYRLSEQAHGS
ncbi:hypothetical protein GT045_15090 [Streptomyces sp. SID486]|uniref:DUF6875 domain-containing protein n=1 Tax=unclassified Streptomyces TaxID=2593676 RepID=UPI0013719527|nr:MULTISPECIES: hypothetical protein [unclassified Streptomyces]MYW17051.1 hypothetical protein [Streptomyces sp. SID2955]MYW43334.1 hypothetical protein [Streptomyces sp. SID161]MYX96104.1 hypothetical protein [Streptomyces sp. SID486]